MDGHSRGRADEIDPADQWVLNPRTGNYELRLDNSGRESSEPPRARDRSGASRTRDRSGGRRESASPRGDVPSQRGRRQPGQGRGQQPPAARKGRRPFSPRRRKALLWTGGVTAFVIVAGSAGAYALYQKFNGNLDTVDVGDAGSKNVAGDGPLDILVIGTDKRTGEGNEGYGDKGSTGHADTNILFHVSADRTNATAMSIPRDLITNIPDCTTKQPDGSRKVVPGTRNVRFNVSLGQEGRDPGCTMRTVKEITGLSVDHFMMVDFNAVKTLSTAVGGVKVCLDKAVKDPDSHLDLPAGESTVEGEDALAFVRTRHSFGNQSDLDRIKVQQQFIGSMIRQMKSDDTLTDPGKLFDLADAATKALTVDSGIGSINKLTSLARELGKIDTKNITFVTMPVKDNPAEPTPVTVVVEPQKAGPLFAMMRSDTSLTEVKKKEQAAKDKQQAVLEGSRAEAADIRVDVLNGGGITGAAGATVEWLRSEQGVTQSTNGANAPAKIDRTTLAYAPDQADQARALADIMGLPATALKQGTSDSDGLQAMVLTLGADFEGAGVPLTGPAKAPEDIQRADADTAVCAK
ncbi:MULTISPECIES: LCP family protein [unclassified Streptomyces]|uniref:LCP family protein n=1 Tax=unclassified Streptomyces TaxID=2593676 RepID=UPI0011CC0D53|nr:MULTISPECIES: LCP family protein [unclassified Streptomyces]TXS09285.1 LytR family transcriptional regulator [Streptomyces sp. wa22]WSQ79473.1 LCP family protein [Streptomyces sp. NBC_01213]WSR07129.1 LCP family protein [Streptomyces sp. NBC_01208]WSR50129.1 LCP family protein [Streptomyces sp. NBC_01201]